MKPSRTRIANKPRFAVDINTSYSLLNRNFGGFATFTSTAMLTKKQDSSDEEIIKTASSKDYHIITHNTKHFENAPIKLDKLEIGIICVNLQEDNYINQFGKLLRRYKKHDNFKNKLIYLGNKIKILKYSQLRSK